MSAAHADDWGDILKPLVKEVLIPGAQLGVKTWKARKKNDGSKPQATSTDTSPSIDWGPPPPAPVTTGDGITPTPEGPSEIFPGDSPLPPPADSSAFEASAPPPPPVSDSGPVVPETQPQAQAQVQVHETSLMVPMAPDGLTVKLTQDPTDSKRYAQLSWRDNAPDETGYEIWQSVAEQGEYQLIHRVKANTTSWSHHYPSPPPESGVFYKVRAFNGQGYSEYSNTVRFSRG